jgi:ubiquinone biosynthesis monooxygenase Coq7
MNTDAIVIAMDSALRTLFAPARFARPTPLARAQDAAFPLSDAEKRLSGALMRVNHVGEVCAQALYTSQALASQDPVLRRQLDAAGREETDHLAWTAERLAELGDRPSYLTPVWYAGAFAIGFAAGKLGGDRVSLGFVVETERQVGAHLASHMDALPANDQASRAIVQQMKSDEAAHARLAEKAGATELPLPVRGLMKLAAKVMTTVAHRI